MFCTPRPNGGPVIGSLMDDPVPVGGELEPLERTRLRREYEADGRGIGFFGLEIDVAAGEGRDHLALIV